MMLARRHFRRQQLLDMVRAMGAQDLLAGRLRRLFAQQVHEFFRRKGVQLGRQAVGAFRMIVAGVVLKAHGVRKKERGHFVSSDVPLRVSFIYADVS